MSLTTTYAGVRTRGNFYSYDPTIMTNPDGVASPQGDPILIGDLPDGDMLVRFDFANQSKRHHVLEGQTNGSITRLTGGDYVIAAELGDRIALTRYDSAGLFKSSTTITLDDYGDPTIRALNNGGFVVVGTAENANGSSSIMARTYNSNGGLVRQITVDPSTTDIQTNPDVTVLNNGNVVFVWSEARTDGKMHAYYAIYTPAGTLVKAQSSINAVTVAEQNPSITALPDGGFAVASEAANGGGTIVQRYSSAGALLDIATFAAPAGTTDSNPQLGVYSNGMLALSVERAGAPDQLIMLDTDLNPITFSNPFRDGEETEMFRSSDGTMWVLSGGLGDIYATELTVERRVTGDQFDDIWYGDTYRSTVNAGGGRDRLYGGEGTEFLNGGAGDDIIQGGGGNDTLTGGTGADILIGGEGRDTINYSSSTLGVMIDLVNGRGYGGDATGDIISGVENFWGSSFNDVVYGDDNENVLSGGYGNDILMGGGGRDVLQGQAGDDLLRGGPGRDTLDGGEGFDTVDYSAAGYGLFVDLHPLAESDDGEGGVDTLISIERILGSRFDDVILGHTAAETLAGGAGNDELWGRDGDDTLLGGDGDDYLTGEQGADTLDGGAGRDTVSYQFATSGVTVRLDFGTASDGQGSTDTLISIEDVLGTQFDDFIVGDGGDNFLAGDGGFDTLIGGGGNDTLRGGSTGASTLQGGIGNDRYIVLGTADTIVELAGEGIDTVESFINAFTLGANFENLEHIGSGDFTGTGNALNNVITGYVGNDILRGRGGNDTLNGGLGMDTADYSLAASGVTIRLDLQRATNDGDGGVDTFISIEAAVGSAFADFMVGGTGDDQLDGGLGADTLLGGAGNDILIGGSGAANTLQGGAGDDRYIVNANDTIVELAGEGNDTVVTRLNTFTLPTNVERLFFEGVGDFVGIGNAEDNQIGGSAGNDIFRGMGGSDSFGGGAGTDEIQFRGTRAEYQIEALIGSYRITDLVAGRDGTATVNRVEFARFLGDGVVVALPALDQDPFTPGFQGAPVLNEKSTGDEPLVLPGVSDDDFVDLKGVSETTAPQVQPLADDAFTPSVATGGGLSGGNDLDMGLDVGPFSGIDVHALRQEMEGRHGHSWTYEQLF